MTEADEVLHNNHSLNYQLYMQPRYLRTAPRSTNCWSEPSHGWVRWDAEPPANALRSGSPGTKQSPESRCS